MLHDTPTGTETALLGLLSRLDVDAWVAQALRELTGATPVRTLFRAGRIDAVYGLQADDGRRLVLKIHRPPVDFDARRVVTGAQRTLAQAGFPCPAPIAGPVDVDGRAVSVETMLDGAGRTGKDPAVRRATAAALAEQIVILDDALPGLGQSLGAPPAWCDYISGPWPTPHDPVFDFSCTPAGFGWLDDFARRASEVLIRDRAREDRRVVVGHADWYCGNLRFAGDRLVAALDWDLVADTAPIIAGLSAGGYRTDATPGPEDVAAYLADFEDAWVRPFSAQDRSSAFAAAAWMIAFNARCDLDNRGRGIDDGTALSALHNHGEAYFV